MMRQNVARDINRAGLHTVQLSINSGLAAPSRETPRARDARHNDVLCDDAAKPELIDSCTVRIVPSVLSHATFCRTSIPVGPTCESNGVTFDWAKFKIAASRHLKKCR